MAEAVVQRCSVKMVFLEISQNSQENTSARVSFLIKLQDVIKKETLTQVFSCEFCEVSKNTFFHRTPLLAASEMATELTCSVCVGVAGEAHKCILCKKKWFTCSVRKARRMRRDLQKLLFVLHVEEKRYKHFFIKVFYYMVFRKEIDFVSFFIVSLCLCLGWAPIFYN